MLIYSLNKYFMNANLVRVTELCVKDERRKEEDQSPAHQCLPVQLEKNHNAKFYLSNTRDVTEWMLQVLGFQAEELMNVLQKRRRVQLSLEKWGEQKTN